MRIEIDQSGKIEQTNKPTVVALSNHKTKSVKITAVEKQKLIKTILELGRPNRTYAYQALAVLIFFLLRQEKFTEVLIDTEYQGHTASIKEILIQLFQKECLAFPEIKFGLIGKKSRAHSLAIKVFRKEGKPDLLLKATDVLELLYKKRLQ